MSEAISMQSRGGEIREGESVARLHAMSEAISMQSHGGEIREGESLARLQVRRRARLVRGASTQIHLQKKLDGLLGHISETWRGVELSWVLGNISVTSR